MAVFLPAFETPPILSGGDAVLGALPADPVLAWIRQLVSHQNAGERLPSRTVSRARGSR